MDRFTSLEEIQTPRLSLNADPSCWQAAADQRMAATNQLTVSRQPANNPSHNIQPGIANVECLLYHLLMDYQQPVDIWSGVWKYFLFVLIFNCEFHVKVKQKVLRGT